VKPLGPTRLGNLALVAVVVAVTSYLLVRLWYGLLPKLPWPPIVTVFVLTLLEAALARGTQARIDRRPGTRPVEPLLVARLVALAKASAVVGALLLGGWLGALAYVWSERSRLAAASVDVPVAAAGVLGALLFLAVALWLEHCCRTPKPPDDDEQSTTARSGHTP